MHTKKEEQLSGHMIQSIPLPTEESLSSESLQTSDRTMPVLGAPAGFDREEAWLLANLVRVAYNWICIGAKSLRQAKGNLLYFSRHNGAQRVVQ